MTPAQMQEAADFGRAVKRMSATTYEVNGNYAYAAGYLESLCCEMFRSLPRAQRAQFLRQMERDAARLEGLAQVAGVSV